MKKLIALLCCLLTMTLYAQVDTTGINKSDSKGRKQGVWKKYENGKLVYEGQFKDNVPYGTFKYYFTNGKLKSVSEFQQGVHKVKSTIYHENGKVASEGLFIDQIKDGVWNYYAKNGQLITIENYALGKRTGEWKTFSVEGNLLEETHYLNDKLNGVHKTYYTDGNVSLEETYLEGQRNGRCTSYLPKNVMSSTGEYLKGQRIGEWHYYDPKGKIRTTEEHKNNRIVKTYIYLYVKGQAQKVNQDAIAYFMKTGEQTVVVMRGGNKIAQDEDLNDVALWVDFTNFTRVSPRILAANSAIAGYKTDKDSENGSIIVRLRPATSEPVYAEGLEAQMVKALFNTAKPKED